VCEHLRDGRQDEGVRPDELQIRDIGSDDDRFDAVLRLASSILEQDRYLVRDYPHALESHVLAAFFRDACAGFLRLLVQVIGSEEGRPPVLHQGTPLTEGFVEAFGVAPSARRRGIGTALQATAIEHSRSAGCWQMRSRSPVTSVENYALKLAAGYALHPSEQNDSYYFVLKL
jgi:GNAT superfamily N-acetyltransferase